MPQNNFVLDVNVYVSFILGKKIYKLAKLSEAGLSIYTSSTLLAELADVLNRTKFKKYLPLPPSKYIEVFKDFTLLVNEADILEKSINSPDKNDNYLFELTLNTESVLVTGDKELLYWKNSPVAVISLNSFIKLYKT